MTLFFLDLQHQGPSRLDFASFFLLFDLDSQSYKRIFFPLDYWASDITARSFSAHIGKHKLGVTYFLFLLLIWQHIFRLNVYKGRFAYRYQTKDQRQSIFYREYPLPTPLEKIPKLYGVLQTIPNNIG
jgi:hypothetical protein